MERRSVFATNDVPRGSERAGRPRPYGETQCRFCGIRDCAYYFVDGTRSVPTTLDCAVLGFVAEDFAGVGDIKSWGFVAALPVHDCEVDSFDINAAPDQLC